MKAAIFTAVAEGRLTLRLLVMKTGKKGFGERFPDRVDEALDKICAISPLHIHVSNRSSAGSAAAFDCGDAVLFNLKVCTEAATEAMAHLAAVERLRARLFAIATPDHTIAQLGQAFLKDLPELFDYRSAALYLLNNSGKLERLETEGDFLRDFGSPALVFTRGREVLDWLLNPVRGAVSVLSDKADQSLAQRIDRDYREIAGADRIVERAALNGSTKPFGLVELCYVPAACGDDKAVKTCLSVASSALASAITLLRSRNDSFVLAQVSSSLTGTESGDEERYLEKALEEMLGAIANRMHDYRAGVLRIVRPGNVIGICAKAGDPGITWDHWHDSQLKGGEFLAGEVFAEGKGRAVEDIEREPSLFKNGAWLRENGLKSCVCCPLIVDKETIGTITLYCGFITRFSDLDVALVQAFADRFAAFRGRSRMAAELERMREREHERRVTLARTSAFQVSQRHYLQVIHDTKNRLIGAVLNLKAARDADEQTRDNLIDAVISSLRQQEALLASSIRSASEATSTEGAPGKVDINALIRALVKDKTADLSLAKIEVALNLGEIPKMKIIVSDISEIIVNLLSNAIRSVRAAHQLRERSTGGRIVIQTAVQEVVVDKEQGPNRYLDIKIRDNGTGMSPSVKKKLFEQGVTTSASAGGTGLGLYIVRQIVREYEGDISFESDEGAWTEFHVRLPMWRLA